MIASVSAQEKGFSEKQGVSETLATQAADLERLETILRELVEAVVVCDPNARILLYNSAARRLFQNREALRLGQSLYRLCTRAPVEHSLRLLRYRAVKKNHSEVEEPGTRFVCATVEGAKLLNCHVDLIASDLIQGSVFAFTFEDITRKTSEAVSAEEKQIAQALLAPTGRTLWVAREEDLDAVTALSGSGPAYVFYFVEAKMQAAQEMGLSAEQGKQLALATFAGATALAQASDEPPEVLRVRVTSKGGTTHAALTSLEASGVKAAFVKALKAAQQRARELGDEFG